MLRRSVAEWNQWREEREWVEIDFLPGADLSNLDLTEANFTGVRAVEASFENSRLYEAFAVSFRGASFRGANLTDSHFYGCDFSACGFEDAILEGASFGGCSLQAANFAGSVLAATNFGNVDLSSAVNLEHAEQWFPSSISTLALRDSRGRIPEAFLKGCGLSAVEILTSKLWDPDLNADELTTLLYRIHNLKTTAPIQKRYVFISYSHHDAPFVDQLEQRFDALGIRFWCDKHDLKAGRIETQIDRAIGVHSIVLLVLSKHSVASDWVEWEVSKARAVEKLHKRDVICPVALDDAWETADWPGPLRRQIEDYHVLDLSSPSEKDFAKLIDGLNLFY